jgi:hypothetical protein
MPKGRSQVQEEVETLKAQLEHALARIYALEARQAEMDEAFTLGNLPKPPRPIRV